MWVIQNPIFFRNIFLINELYWKSKELIHHEDGFGLSEEIIGDSIRPGCFPICDAWNFGACLSC